MKTTLLIIFILAITCVNGYFFYRNVKTNTPIVSQSSKSNGNFVPTKEEVASSKNNQDVISTGNIAIPPTSSLSSGTITLPGSRTGEVIANPVEGSFIESNDIRYNNYINPENGNVRVGEDGNLIYESKKLSETGALIKIIPEKITKDAHPYCESDFDMAIGYSIISQDELYAIVGHSKTGCARDGVGGILIFDKTSKKLIDFTFGTGGGFLGEQFGYISSAGRDQCPTQFIPVSGGILVQSCYFSGSVNTSPFGIPFTYDSLTKFKNISYGTWFGYGKRNGANYIKGINNTDYLYNDAIFPFSAFISGDELQSSIETGRYDYK